MSQQQDEGYLKFELQWNQAAIHVPPSLLRELERWRGQLYAAGLVGAYPDGVGFGNVSCRVPGSSGSPAQFYITGSATGNFAHLQEQHYALVTDYSLAQNTLSCTGLTKASSESLSHAAIYEAVPDAQAVVHIHHRRIWEAYCDRLPTTPRDATYGTPEMALALRGLAGRYQDRAPADAERVIIMGGHQDGVVCFGETLADAGEPLLRLVTSVSDGPDPRETT